MQGIAAATRDGSGLPPMLLIGRSGVGHQVRNADRRCRGRVLHRPGTGPAAATGVGIAKTAIAGAAATATANPPARISRRTESSRVAIVTLSVVSDLLVGEFMEAERNLHTSTSSLRMRPLRLRIGPLYGLALMVERGTAAAASASFSARPMHAPDLRLPVHGTPSISGMSGLAAVVVNPWGELGTRNVRAGSREHVLFLTGMHAARGFDSVECVGCATIAAAGNGDREGESAGENQASGCDRISRHTVAFCRR